MGGAIGTLFLETYPGYFKKAVLNAPMMQINTGKYSNFIAELLAKFYIAIGKVVVQSTDICIIYRI